MSRPVRILTWILGTLAALAVVAVAAAWLVLRASLPRVEGEARLAGLDAPVTIERDAAGVPVIRGATRADVARATGFAHAQDRLFQMDLLRRTGAGELAGLLGAGLLDADRAIRLHQFRLRAREALAAIDAADRALLEAYAEGVNAGAASLDARPFEYWLLGRSPSQWRAEDSMLVVYAMWIDLQGLSDADEQQRGRLAAVLPDAAYRLLVEPDASSEAPLDGSRLPEVPLPTPDEFDLRALDRALFETAAETVALERDSPRRGSNNWAVAGSRAADGGALVANDMHLGLRVPNIWYRVRLVVDGGADVAGVSLPGVPAIIAGSNGHVAWGFTNSYGDFQDLVRLQPGSAPGTYLADSGPRAFEVSEETLEVAGGEPERLTVRRTIWGPVIGDDGAGHELALAWTAHRDGATDMALLSLERARGLDEAAAAIGGAGMPGQNVMIADSTGRIGWVLSGRLPRRQGIDALRPSPWHAEGAGWDGWLPREESPRLLDPPQGYAWSANARVVGGEAYARIGDGDYAAAARARQIRDRLAALERATPADLLAIQLDDRADYVARWQPLFLRALERAGEAEAARLVAGWSGHAAIDDAGYRLARVFERKVVGARFPHDRRAGYRALARLRLARAGAFYGGGLATGRYAAGRISWIRASPIGMRGSPMSHAMRWRTCRRAAKASRTAAGARSTRRVSNTRSARLCRRSPHSSTCPPSRCPATGPCRAYSRRDSARRNASASRQAARPRAISTCRAGRAATRCRRSIARATKTGSRVGPRLSCLDRRRTSCASCRPAPEPRHAL